VVESWQAEQAAVMGELTKVVGAASHGLARLQTQGAAVVQATPPSPVPLVKLLVEKSWP
jgi:hypothetical protein